MKINRKELYDILDGVLIVTDEWGGCKLASWQWGSNVVVNGIDDAIDEILNYLGISESEEDEEKGQNLDNCDVNGGTCKSILQEKCYEDSIRKLDSKMLGLIDSQEQLGTINGEQIAEESIDAKRERIMKSMPKEFFETPPMPQHVLDDFSDSKNRIENIERKCNCDLFGKNMLALHESCEMAALEPMKYCPWCGGKVEQLQEDNYSIRLQKSLKDDECEIAILANKRFGGKEHLIDDRVSFDLSVIPIAEESENDEAGKA